MQFELDDRNWTVQRLIALWPTKVRRNSEYQRGARWNPAQKQCFIDSIFRGYPIPALFLHKVTDTDADGNPIVLYDLVDGQQRLLSLHGYVNGKFHLLTPENRQLRLPRSLRGEPVPWAGKSFGQLPDELQAALRNRVLTVILIRDVYNSDEVRDIFIRLQSGTALSRQQIRDAWPGNVAPFVSGLAGRFHETPPTVDLFRLVRRDSRVEDEDQDPYVDHRQTCAQLLCLFLGREHNPYTCPSVSAADLDMLYHEETTFPIGELPAKQFRSLLEQTERIVRFTNMGRGRKKMLKHDLFCIFMFLHDLSRNPLNVIDDRLRYELAERLAETTLPPTSGKRTSGPAIADAYEKWRLTVGDELVRKKDSNRFFSDEQKRQIRLRQNGICARCNKPVLDDEQDYDHFPIPWRDGGPTDVSNGQLVHRRRECHPRGRPPSS
jgi:hypothetical protein